MIEQNQGISTFLTIIIIVLVLVIALAGGVFYINIISHQKVTSNNMIKEELPDESLGQKETENESKTTDNIKDCGESNILLGYQSITGVNFEEDSALVCLGKFLVNNYENSNALVKIEFTDTEEIFEVSTDSMIYRIVTAKENINPEALNSPYSDTWMSGYSVKCPLKRFLYESIAGSLVKKDNIENKPGEFAMGIFMSLGFIFPNNYNNPETAENALNIGCSLIKGR